LSTRLIGARVRRVEDPPLITGRGQYAGDVKLAGLAHLVIYRSPYGQARIDRIDLEAVRQAPGVLAAWTPADLPELAPGLLDMVPPNFVTHFRPVLAKGVAHYQGEPLAVIVAETPYQAADALDLVVAELEPLDVVGSLDVAVGPNPPLVHEDMGSNVLGTATTSYGDVDAAFADGGVTVSASFRLPRISGGYMEPRVVTARYEDGTLTIWASTQWTFGIRDRAADLLGLEKDSVHVLAPDVGGGFGPKGDVYPEEMIVAAATKRLGRPVRWVGSRTEDTLASAQGHGQRVDLELAAGPDGRLRGLRGRMWHDCGAYSGAGSIAPDVIIPHMVSAYHLPALSVQYQMVHTNAVQGGFVRGGGRPVGNFVMERMMDQLARRLGREPSDIRRLNLIQPEEMPYDTRVPAMHETIIYDGGDYPRLLSMVERELADVREGPREDGRVVGRGIVCCVESSSFGAGEPGRGRLDRDGTARLFVGSTPQGQGHRTMAAQVFAERLGWPLDRVQVIAGDSRVVGWALLTAGSRSAVMVGNAASLAGRGLRRKLLEQAAEVLEADPADLVMEDGRISVRGAPTRVVDAVKVIPEDGLEAYESFDPSLPSTYPSSCHGAVVAVDPETGSVEVERYVIAHDTGEVINPMTLAGQMQGGYAHGLGYALFEEVVYRPDGSMATASFLDYSVPGVPEVGVPELLPLSTEKTDANPEGFKGAGESGTLPVPAAICSAVERALWHLNPDAVVTRIPLTPERVLALARARA
jgi:carbon-monoxide dehydrogenase large subunit